MSSSKSSSYVEKRLGSEVEAENDRLSIKDEPNQAVDKSNTVIPLQTHDEPNDLLNPCSNDLIDDSEDKTFSSSGNDPLMVKL